MSTGPTFFSTGDKSFKRMQLYLIRLHLSCFLGIWQNDLCVISVPQVNCCIVDLKKLCLGPNLVIWIIYFQTNASHAWSHANESQATHRSTAKFQPPLAKHSRKCESTKRLEHGSRQESHGSKRPHYRTAEDSVPTGKVSPWKF